MKNFEIVRVKENFQIYNWLKKKDNVYNLNGTGKSKKFEKQKRRLERENAELRKIYWITLEERKNTKKNVSGLLKDLYFWYNKKRGEQDQSLDC